VVDWRAIPRTVHQLSDGMQFGITMFPTDQSIRPDDLAREVESRGFESLWFPEHTHIPTERRTPYPNGGELPEEYKRTLDPFVSCTAAAMVTTRLRVGTGICLVAQRDPIHTAKEVASVDFLTGGRFEFGIGFGWNHDEMEDHGVIPAERRAVAREKMLAVKQLWTQDVGEFQGDHVRVSPSWSWPKPVQRPHPPVHIGGAAGPTLFRHLAEYADGWIPIGGRGMGDSLPALHAEFERAGRDPASIIVTVFAALAEAGRLERYQSRGVYRTVFALPAAGRDVVLPLLDRYMDVMRAVQGAA
jgi:probable F420-dependent oxidoreductase